MQADHLRVVARSADENSAVRAFLNDNPNESVAEQVVDDGDERDGHAQQDDLRGGQAGGRSEEHAGGGEDHRRREQYRPQRGDAPGRQPDHPPVPPAAEAGEPVLEELQVAARLLHLVQERDDDDRDLRRAEPSRPPTPRLLVPLSPPRPGERLARYCRRCSGVVGENWPGGAPGWAASACATRASR